MDFSYRFFQGKNGANGHACSRKEGQQFTLRGLKAGAECTVYCWQSGVAECVFRGKADENGALQVSGLPDGALFAAADGQVILWEKDTPEENYFRACAALQHVREKEEDVRSLSPAKIETKEQPEEKPAEEKEAEGQKELAKAYLLRDPGCAPEVDQLPEMIFPGKAAALKKYFLSCPVIRPFEAPGWHFVRAPSPLPGAAYCVLGYLPIHGRVRKIAYAVPGAPHHPPAQLPGYSYHGGYWVLIQDAE